MFYDSWTNSEPLANYEQHTEIYKYISSVKGKLCDYSFKNTTSIKNICLGTSILRMLNHTFTESIFKQTLREFVHTE